MKTQDLQIFADHIENTAKMTLPFQVMAALFQL